MTLKIGILGAGRMGKIHCDNLIHGQYNAKVMAICDPFLDEAWVCEKPIPHKLKDEALFWSLDLDAVVIASPASHHVEQVKKAIHFRRHILCEKPLSLSLADHEMVSRILADSPVLFQIGFNRRFDADFVAIKERLTKGEIGNPYYLKITSRDPRLPQFEYIPSSGGMFMDMSIHDFDMAAHMMSSPIIEVFAWGGIFVEPRLAEWQDIDTAMITLKFENQGLGHIDNSRQAVYGYDQRLEIFGQKGLLKNHNHQKNTVSYWGEEGARAEKPLWFFLERYAGSYQSELACFIESCQLHKKANPSIEEAIQAIKAALAAKRSQQENRPVSLQEIG